MGIYSTPEPCNFGDCDAEPTRRYMNGWYCVNHTPAKLAGRQEVVPPKLDLKPLVGASSARDDRAIYRQRRAARIAAKRTNRTN